MFDRLRSSLIEPAARFDQKYFSWLFASLLFAALLASPALKIAFSSPFVIQDDARQYVMLMHRITDPQLFPNDFITQYYDAVTPSGYKAFYWLAAVAGISPVVLNKLLPMLLALAGTVFLFAFCFELLPLPVNGFLACVLLNQNLWTKEDLPSGTPRSFVYPLFLAFLYYLQRSSWWGCLALVLLQAIFFPLIAFISITILALTAARLRNKKTVSLLAVSIILCALALLPYIRESAQFGPIVGKQEAKTMTAFQGVWTQQPFFNNHGFSFWFSGWHSGLFPYGMRPPLILSALLFPILYLLKWTPPSFKQASTILLAVVIASLAWFAAAHLLLFKLYNPGRYTQHTLPIVFAIAAGLSLTVIFKRAMQSHFLAGFILASLIMIVLIVQTERTFAYGYGYKTNIIGRQTSLYRFFQSRPKSILIASLSREADNLPAFSRRTTFVGREYFLPYHLRYFNEINRRGTDLLRAQYSDDPSDLKSFLQRYPVDYLLVDSNAFSTNYVEVNDWLNVFQPAVEEVKSSLKAGHVPVLASFLRQDSGCVPFRDKDFILLDAACVRDALARPVHKEQ